MPGFVVVFIYLSFDIEYIEFSYFPIHRGYSVGICLILLEISLSCHSFDKYVLIRLFDVLMLFFWCTLFVYLMFWCYSFDKYVIYSFI